MWFGSMAIAQNAHFVGEPTCVDIGTQVRCSGKTPDSVRAP